MSNTPAPQAGAARMNRDERMSSKEYETLLLLAQGLSAGQIAAHLNVSKNYVYALVRLLKARFSTGTTAGIVAQAMREGYIEGDFSHWDEEDEP